MTEETPIVAEEPAVTPEPVAPEASVPEPEPEPSPAPNPEPVAAEKPKQVPWYMKRINQQSAKIADLSRTLETLVQQRTAEPAPIAEPPAEGEQPAAPKPAVNQTQARIEAAAARLVAQQRFDEACNNVMDQGKKEFADFDDTVRTLGAVGIINQPFLEAVTSLSEPARLLDHLGKNPEEAQRIAALPPVRQAVELAKIETGFAKKPVAVVSKVPAPIRPVNGAARVTDELNDQDDIKTWMAKRAKQRAAREGRA